jgi:hypothetical protein
VHEGNLYPHLSALPAPWTEALTAEDNPARALLAGFRKSKWLRPEVDPVLLLGWIGGAYLGGALDWRPSALLLGDKGTGKSTLQNTLKVLFGDALFHSSDSTAAGIYQAMGHDSRAVALDEMEPGMDARKASNIADLMRSSASGAIGRRGSSDGTANAYQMRSAFLFSAINNPLHTAADLSRVAVLRMLPFDKDSERPEPINAETAGPKVLAQMMRAWGDNGQGFRDQYARFAEALKQGGHDKRGQDTYGTLLACAAMMLGDDLAAELDVKVGPEEERWWTEHLSVENLPETEDATPNYRQCLNRILTTTVRDWRNVSYNTIGQVVRALRSVDDDGARRPDGSQQGEAGNRYRRLRPAECPRSRGSGGPRGGQEGHHHQGRGRAAEIRPAGGRLGARRAQQVDQGLETPGGQRLARRRLERRAAAMPGAGRDDRQQ